MQTIATYPQPSETLPGMPDFGPGFYAHDKGADHPTPPAPDRGKPAPKPAPEPAKKK